MSSDPTMQDAFKYVHALAIADIDELFRIESEYGDDRLRDLFGAVGGISLGIFKTASERFRGQIIAQCQYGITDDKSHLDKALELQDRPGQYL